MQTGIGDTQNKWWQTYLSAGMATGPHPVQVCPDGCDVEKGIRYLIILFLIASLIKVHIEESKKLKYNYLFFSDKELAFISIFFYIVIYYG